MEILHFSASKSVKNTNFQISAAAKLIVTQRYNVSRGCEVQI
jgi:hypothetical protein